MKSERYIQSIASFLVALVLTIPFYTTSAYASITKISVKGSDNIDGFAREDDYLSFNVQAAISGDTITNNQVVAGSDLQFDECTPSASNGSECTLRIPKNGTESFDSMSIPFTINLFKDDNTLDDTKSGIVTIDNKAPKVKLSTAKSKFSLQESVVVNYEVTDFACNDASCAGKCAGIKNIEFYTLDGTFERTVEVATGNCTSKSSITVEPSAFSDGINSVFALAADKFDQFSEEASVTFNVDASAPAVIPGSFAIIRKGISLNSFSQNKVSSDVVVNISGSDLDANSVKADLSALNPALKNVKASCTKAKDDLSACKWTIELAPGTGGSKTIIINASDKSGNTESASITKQLSVDNKGPVVQSLSTAMPIAGKMVVKPSGNTITAVFDDSSGLSADDAFLHIESAKIRATRCYKETGWICVWDNMNFGTSGKMSIQSDTLDVLGNGVGGEFSVSVTLDSGTPVLKSIDITNIGGLAEAFPGFFKTGDKIAVQANLTEENGLIASADFSKFVAGADNEAGTCEGAGDSHICTWITEPINLQASDSAVFNFSDSAGNNLVVTKSLRTYGLDNTTAPDFWSSSVECSPKTIDRQLGTLINQRAYCHVSLKQKSKQASTVFISQASCSGSSIIENVETFNTEPGSISPVIKITLKKDEFKINNASLSCSLSIFSKTGSSSTITRNPEVENVKINLEFSNLPLGEISKDIERKIEEAKDDAEGIWKLIGVLNKIIFYAKKICQIIGTIYNTVQVLYSIAYALNLASASTYAVPIIGGKVNAAAITGCNAETGARGVAQVTKEGLNKYCDYVNCRQTFLWGPQMQEQINKLPLSDYLPRTINEKGEIIQSQSGLAKYMDAQHNLFVATLFVCIPGIVYGLDKYRQIKCLYADCLQSAVGKEGLPVTVCEDEKAYATCKYVTGEMFALIPYTAVFDYFMRLVRNALSNPFSALGVGVALLCTSTCKNTEPVSRIASWGACEYARLFSQVGVVLQDITSIIDEGFTIREDYCSRLDTDEKESEEVADSTTQGKDKQGTTKTKAQT